MNSKREVKGDPRRGLPGTDRLARALAAVHPELPGWALTEGARQALAEAREALGADVSHLPAEEALTGRALERARRLSRRPRPLVNATGVILHTNLGRAPLAPGAAAAAAEAAGYTDLEFALESGERGDRMAGVAAKLTLLGGSEAALAVNNNAAALLLALDTLARGREVVVSRGELVEIGGSFRIPEIVARAGVRLVEVGTTNRTHLADYRRAIGPATALLLKVHRSNFDQRGFVAEVDLAELVALGREHELPVVEDLGSGSFVDLTGRGLPAEADARTRIRLGADVVCFSGDKLLGGPQAGIALGRRGVIDAMRANPLARALRLDKLGLAALDWTLSMLLEGRARELPVLGQLLATLPELEARARELAARLVRLAGGTARVEVEPARARVGGGTLPGFELDTWVVTLASPALSAERLAAGLRQAALPVVARVQDERVLLDVRSLLPGDEERIAASLAEALAPAAR